VMAHMPGGRGYTEKKDDCENDLVDAFKGSELAQLKDITKETQITLLEERRGNGGRMGGKKRVALNKCSLRNRAVIIDIDGVKKKTDHI